MFAPDPAPHTGNAKLVYAHYRQYTVPVTVTDPATGRVLGRWSETCRGPLFGPLKCSLTGGFRVVAAKSV